ncbi:unannotated protein [freshwater metagenome]|uniref:Unannotated protein n=1 Tax=freshwater metagenome TaxID=449393 RepID=A0A6J7XR12_9ZZZZ|nr:tyrosine recombinase [Actinomycetota bacterium]
MKAMSNKIFQSFLDHLRIERGLAPNSIEAYKRDLAKFSGYMNDKGIEISQVEESHFLEFLDGLRSSGLSQGSVNRNLSSLRSFFKYLANEFDVPNVTTGLAVAQLPKRLPKALTVSEIFLLIDSADRLDNPTSLRDKALLELLYSSGGRVSELIGSNLGDFTSLETESGSVTILKLRGKGGKERVVPLGSFAVKAIENYLTRTRPLLATRNSKGTGALFLNSRGTRLTRQSAWNVVTAAAKQTGLEGKVSPHVFRHSYATHLLDGGADIRVVQELLGHASVTTTQIYTLITIDKVRETYSLSHPRART